MFQIDWVFFIPNSPAAPKFAQSLSHILTTVHEDLHGTSLNSPTHLPYAFWDPATVIHTVPLTNRKACSCPKTYPKPSLLCL